MNKKPKEIELKEEKNDFDEQEIQNNLNKSNIFEKGLRDRISTTESYIKKLSNRKSLVDNYNSKQIQNLNNNKNNNNKEISDNKQDKKDNIDNNEDININNKNNENEFNKKYSNINIDEELSNNNNNKTSPVKNEEIKEEIEETPSIYQPKIVNNSQTQLSETHINNLKITQTTNYGIKSFNIHTIKKGFEICKEIDIYYKSKKIEKILSVKNNENIEYLNKTKPKEKLIKFIESNFINNIKDENDLKEIESWVEKFLGEIRLKIGKEEKDALFEKIVNKYSKIILDKINNQNNNKDTDKKDNIDNNDSDNSDNVNL